MRSRACCRKGAPTPGVSAKPCFSCGELREAQWFHVDCRKSTGLASRCMPCVKLYDQQRLERIRREGKSQEPAAEKECCVCEKTLPISSFHNCPSSCDGFKKKCKDCVRKESAACYSERKERFSRQPPVAPAGEERICSACGSAKPWSEFSKDPRSIYGIGSECMQCRNKRGEIYRRRAYLSAVSDTSDNL